MFFKKSSKFNSREEDILKQQQYKNDPLSYSPPPSSTTEDKDLIEIFTTINYSELVRLYYIEIWVMIIIIIATIYFTRLKLSKIQSKDFNPTIVNKNNERAKIAREKLESSYANDLKTKPIPPSSDNHDYTKKFNNNDNSNSNNNNSFKSTEGMNPSTTRQRVTFSSRDRSFVKYH